MILDFRSGNLLGQGPKEAPIANQIKNNLAIFSVGKPPFPTALLCGFPSAGIDSPSIYKNAVFRLGVSFRRLPLNCLTSESA